MSLNTFPIIWRKKGYSRFTHQVESYETLKLPGRYYPNFSYIEQEPGTHKTPTGDRVRPIVPQGKTHSTRPHHRDRNCPVSIERNAMNTQHNSDPCNPKTTRITTRKCSTSIQMCPEPRAKPRVKPSHSPSWAAFRDAGTGGGGGAVSGGNLPHNFEAVGALKVVHFFARELGSLPKNSRPNPGSF